MEGSSGFAARIKELIHRAGGAASLVRKCGNAFTESAVRKWQAGAEPARPHLEAISKGMGVSIQWLVTGVDPQDEIEKALSELRSATNAAILFVLRRAPMTRDDVNELQEVAMSERLDVEGLEKRFGHRYTVKRHPVDAGMLSIAMREVAHMLRASGSHKVEEPQHAYGDQVERASRLTARVYEFLQMNGQSDAEAARKFLTDVLR